MTEEALRLKARKQIIAIVIVGFVVLVCDLFIAGRGSTLELVQGEKGSYLVRPSAGQDAGHISLRADVDGKDFSKSFDLRVDSIEGAGGSGSGGSGEGGDSDDGDEADGDGSGDSDGSSNGGMSDGELVAYEVRSAVNSVNDDTTGSRVYLPDKLSTGDQVHWSIERRTNTVLIIFTIVLLALLIYRNRFAPLRRQMAAEQDSIERQLPEFVNRIVLLLNAGLVLNSAFEKAISVNADYEADASVDEDFFFTRMKEIQSRVRQTNVSMNREFGDFAKSRRCAGGETSRQLMRISNIINDNISKGVELTEKLQRESEILWLARKRRCEERGRLAETKLTLPLTLFLLVLIVITVSPALLEL